VLTFLFSSSHQTEKGLKYAIISPQNF
jgi:hypothetical protein